MAMEGRKHELQRALVTRILDGDGRASRAQRRAAFDNEVTDEPLRTLVNKVAKEPTRVTDDDIAAVKAAGSSEEEVFELVVCAAAGEATRQYEAAVAALADAAPDGGRD